MKHIAHLIIGFGKGGKSLAAFLGSRGEDVILVEKDPLMYGGTCINVGCIPSKDLIESAKLAPKGGDFISKEAYFLKSMDEKIAFIKKMNRKNYDKAASFKTVKVLDGTASFIGPHQVNVGEETYEADHIYINTGSSSFVPPIPGVKDNELVFLSDSMLSISYLPERLTIIGGGYIGLEFASMFSMFGSKVSILQAEADFMGREDRQAALQVEEDFRLHGIDIIKSVKIQEVKPDGTVLYEVNGSKVSLEGDAVLLATGRRPNTQELNLEKAGIALSPRGGVLVNDFCETNVPEVYALGDVTGGLQFTYLSFDDFRAIRDHILKKEEPYLRSKRGAVPYSVFINPSFSRVGLSEEEALAAGYEIKTAVFMGRWIPKSLILNEYRGINKAVIDKKTGLILGATLYSVDSHEVINIIKMAIDLKLPYVYLRDMIFTHPTMSEALNDLFAA